MYICRQRLKILTFDFVPRSFDSLRTSLLSKIWDSKDKNRVQYCAYMPRCVLCVHCAVYSIQYTVCMLNQRC